MATSASLFNALLIDAPVGRHFAQLHRDAAALQTAVALFAETGLRRNQSVLVFCAPETTTQLLGRLRASGIDTRVATAAGRLRVIDAAAGLSQFMRGGLPNWDEFLKFVSDGLTAGSAAGGTRIYGDMVNLLWRDGRRVAAIRLEEFWNDLGKVYPFTLFCGYMVDTHDHACYGHPISEIARTHTDLDHAGDDAFSVALGAACIEMFGMPIDDMVARSSAPVIASEAALPPGLRSMVWLSRTQPRLSSTLLERARVLLVQARHAEFERQRAARAD